MSNESQTVRSSNPEGGNSMLTILDPRQDIQNIKNQLLGIEVSVETNGSIRKVKKRRKSKPLFTEEYINDLDRDLSHFLNFTVQVSRFEDKRILSKTGRFLLKLNLDMAEHGDDHYISTETWKRVLEVHDSKVYYDDTYNVIYEEDEPRPSTAQKVSGWYRFGFKWSYDDPVTSEMISYIKDDSEEVGQEIVFAKLLESMGTLIEASMNKSFSSALGDKGMLVNAVSEIRTENTIIRDQKKQGWFSRNEEQ